jgi:hypothetical protein
MQIERHSPMVSDILVPLYSSPIQVMFGFVMRVRCLIIDIRNLRVDVHFGRSATVPGSEQHTTATALVLNVLERGHQVGNASQAGETAETESPCAVIPSVLYSRNDSTVSRAVKLEMGANLLYSVTSLICNIGHRPLSACGAISRRRRPVQRSNGSNALVNSSRLLLRRHSRVVRWLDIRALGLLGRRRAGVLLLLRLLLLLGLRIHLVLLELGLVWVLVDGGLLSLVGIWAWALGELVHGYFIAY